MTQKRATTLYLVGGKMARREVVEVLCDRCKRVDLVPKNEAPPEGAEPFFKIQLGDQSVAYVDLCRKCREALTGYFKHCTLVKKDDAEQPAKPVEAVQSVQTKGILSRFQTAKGGGG